MKFYITAKILRDIAGAPVNKDIVAGLVQHLTEIMIDYEINTFLRSAHFLSQCCHECDHFRTLEEYASGRAYEGRKDLGNIYRGDGVRYKGRGMIQLTGRSNYRTIGQKLGIDLENNPELAETPRVACLTAAEFWKSRNLNEFADIDNVKQVTRRINGGYNGLDSRIAMLNRAKAVLRNIDFGP